MAMAAVVSSLSLNPSIHHQISSPKRLSHLSARPVYITRKQRGSPSVVALFGRNTGDDKGKETKKKFITKEEEPDQYWQSAAEKEGRGPMSTVLPYIVIFGFLTPFIILGIAFANGWIKVPVRICLSGLLSLLCLDYFWLFSKNPGLLPLYRL